VKIFYVELERKSTSNGFDKYVLSILSNLIGILNGPVAFVGFSLIISCSISYLVTGLRKKLDVCGGFM
jgi:hypothetical protein